jgi:hypothetical protein
VAALSEAEYELALADDIADFYDDPLGWVFYSFQWGVGELSDFPDGPDKWQAAQLMRVGAQFLLDPETTIREATASGHGIGKSAIVAWIILWAMSTRPHLNGVITANTTTQLSTKTWRELALWHKRLINTHWFKWTATKFFHVEHPETWFCAAIPNTEHNSEAFAGLHARHVLLLYDEASGIPDVIWEVSEGAMTTPRAMWFVYGNPTKNTGRFKDCFDSDKRRWVTNQIDSRTCKMTNKKELADWIETYGEDSDFARVRIKGEFPRAGNVQFIGSDLVDFAMRNEVEYEAHMTMPLVLSVDVARFGDDKSVVLLRQGRKVLRIWKFRELNTMQLATEVNSIITDVKPHAVFIDVIGVGAGVVDRLRMLGKDVIEVNAGLGPQDDKTYYNKRAEMWGRMKNWLLQGADIPNDPELKSALIGIEYGYDEKERIRLERKSDMKSRGLDSPDEGDALAYSFAEIVTGLTEQSFEPDDSFEPESAVA